MNRTERIAIAGLAIASGGNVIAQSIRATTDPLASDYAAFAVGARMLDSRQVCLYSPSGQTTAFISALGPQDAAHAFPFANPPLAALAVYPLAHVSFAIGLSIFLLLSLAALTAGVALLGSALLQYRWSVPVRRSIAVTTMLTLPAAGTFTFGQWDALCLLGLAGSLVLIRRQRLILAGLCLTCLLVKPQLVWLVPVMALVTAEWRLLVGFAIGSMVWAISSLLIVTPTCLAQYPDLIRNEAGQLLRSGGVPGAVAFVTGSAVAGETASVILLLGFIGLALGMRKRLKHDLVVATALTVAASVLAAPHTYPADLLVLSPVFLLVAADRLHWGLGLAVALDIAFVGDSLILGGHPIASVLICLVAIALLGRLRMSHQASRILTGRNA